MRLLLSCSHRLYRDTRAHCSHARLLDDGGLLRRMMYYSCCRLLTTLPGRSLLRVLTTLPGSLCDRRRRASQSGIRCPEQILEQIVDPTPAGRNSGRVREGINRVLGPRGGVDRILLGGPSRGSALGRSETFRSPGRRRSTGPNGRRLVR